MYQLHEHGLNQLIQRQKEALAIRDSLQRLNKLGAIYVDFALENPEYYNLMFIMQAPMKNLEREWPCGFESCNILRQTVEECISAGKLKARNVDAATIAMWSTVHGLASLVIRGRLRMVPEDRLSFVVKDVMKFMEELKAPNQSGG
ncbi:MAG: TetR-like C-terminal domain-containing protein [bacterium]